MRAVKFGGSSVADAERLRTAGVTLVDLRARGPVTVVVSAMAGVTDSLLTIAGEARAGGAGWRDSLRALGERHRAAYLALVGAIPDAFERRWAEVEREATALTGASQDQAESWGATAARFSGWGERLSVGLLAAAVVSAGGQPFALDDAPVQLIGRAGPDSAPEPSLLATRAWLPPRLAMPVMRGAVPILPGYIARDAAGHLTTLGRNSSDHAAAVIAAALGATSLTLYSDVAGVYTADPRVAPGATIIPALTYDEAARIALAGVKALHPRAVGPLGAAAIPLYLRAAAAPEAPGTDIGPRERLTLQYAREPAWVVGAQPDSASGVSLISAIRLDSWPERAEQCDCAARAVETIVDMGLRPLTVARDALSLTAPRARADDAVRALSVALAGCASRHASARLATGA